MNLRRFWISCACSVAVLWHPATIGACLLTVVALSKSIINGLPSRDDAAQAVTLD
jgi:hypothetical protein